MSVDTLIFEFLDEYVNYWCDKLPIITSKVTQTEIISVCGGDYLTDENESPWRLISLYDPNDIQFIGNYDTYTDEILFKQENEKYTFSIPPTDRRPLIKFLWGSDRPIKYLVINKFDAEHIISEFYSYTLGYNQESEKYKKTDEILETISKNNINKNQLIHDIYNMIPYGSLDCTTNMTGHIPYDIKDCNTNVIEHIDYVIQQYLSKHVLR